VSVQRSGFASGDDEIDYRRGSRGGSISRSFARDTAVDL
jgi:hypothetical protein